MRLDTEDESMDTNTYVSSDNYIAIHGLRTKKQRNKEREKLLAEARRLKALETNKVNPTVTPNAPPTLLASPDPLAAPSCAAPDEGTIILLSPA